MTSHTVFLEPDTICYDKEKAVIYRGAILSDAQIFLWFQDVEGNNVLRRCLRQREAPTPCDCDDFVDNGCVDY